MSSAWCSSARGSRATRRAAMSIAALVWPAARLAVTASRSAAWADALTCRRSLSSHASNAAEVGKFIPARRSQPRPGTCEASIQAPDASAQTSTNEPGGRQSWSGSPRRMVGSPRSRRSSARFHRSAPSGSSASENSRAVSRSRGIAPVEQSRYASKAQGFRPLGASARTPSRSILGLPRRWIASAIAPSVPRPAWPLGIPEAGSGTFAATRPHTRLHMPAADHVLIRPRLLYEKGRQRAICPRKARPRYW